MSMKQAAQKIIDAMPPGNARVHVTHEELVMMAHGDWGRAPDVREFAYVIWFRIGDGGTGPFPKGYRVSSDNLDGAVADALAVLNALKSTGMPPNVTVEKLPDACLPMEAIRAAGLETVD